MFEFKNCLFRYIRPISKSHKFTSFFADITKIIKGEFFCSPCELQLHLVRRKLVFDCSKDVYAGSYCNQWRRGG